MTHRQRNQGKRSNRVWRICVVCISQLDRLVCQFQQQGTIVAFTPEAFSLLGLTLFVRSILLDSIRLWPTPSVFSKPNPPASKGWNGLGNEQSWLALCYCAAATGIEIGDQRNRTVGDRLEQRPSPAEWPPLVERRIMAQTMWTRLFQRHFDTCAQPILPF